MKHRSLILGLVYRNYGSCQNVFSRMTAVNFQLNAVFMLISRMAHMMQFIACLKNVMLQYNELNIVTLTLAKFIRVLKAPQM